ncbi:MAG: hypothetical protein D6769_03660 [Methanobacteriota archaeon]|nr:MAG: hypothetical protein D6769_03660 [Euryarchaeota archaeon]
MKKLRFIRDMNRRTTNSRKIVKKTFSKASVKKALGFIPDRLWEPVLAKKYLITPNSSVIVNARATGTAMLV